MASSRRRNNCRWCLRAVISKNIHAHQSISYRQPTLQSKRRYSLQKKRENITISICHAIHPMHLATRLPEELKRLSGHECVILKFTFRSGQSFQLLRDGQFSTIWRTAILVNIQTAISTLKMIFPHVDVDMCFEGTNQRRAVLCLKYLSLYTHTARL